MSGSGAGATGEEEEEEDDDDDDDDDDEEEEEEETSSNTPPKNDKILAAMNAASDNLTFSSPTITPVSMANSLHMYNNEATQLFPTVWNHKDHSTTDLNNPGRSTLLMQVKAPNVPPQAVQTVVPSYNCYSHSPYYSGMGMDFSHFGHSNQPNAYQFPNHHYIAEAGSPSMFRSSATTPSMGYEYESFPNERYQHL